MTSAPPTCFGPVEILAPFRDEQLIARMGITLTSYGPDLVEGTMPVTGNRQPVGLLHGGASAVFAETLGSLAAWLHAGGDRIALGLELSCTHHRAVRSGLVTGVCRPLHVGRSCASYGVDIMDEGRRLVCTARLTCTFTGPGRRR
ncbi:hotdog fold thioesterase [Streptomyces sp. NPDC050560]|uniref:hotdog fold thioesterase n=1 Tax=Streptomyces sp. NPDC050560 TaxID=3365630 RepID=UPI00378E5A72